MIRRESKRWPNRIVLTAVVALMTVAMRAEAIDEGYEGQQGTRLHGTALKLFERTTLTMTNATTAQGVVLQKVVLDRGQLKSGVPALQGAQMVGVRFSATVQNAPVILQIVGAQPHRNVYSDPNAPEGLSATVWEYQVQWNSPKLGSGELCPEGGAALALPGIWNGAIYSHSTTAFSFACLPQRTINGSVVKGGVAAKCVDWGYAPWQSEDPRLDKTALSLTEGDALRHHLACTAMATADFCGEARPNTLSGTPLTMFHRDNVQTEPVTKKPPPPPAVSGGPVGQDFYFEAAWAAVDESTGQPFTSRTGLPAGRMRAQALCLTKKRWATLPPGGTCSIQGPLLDPRTAMTAGPSRYCEEYTRDELLQKGAVLFSYSKFLDAGLYRFKRNNAQTQHTDQYLSTAQIVISPQKPYTYQPDPKVFVNASQYKLDTDIPLGFEGPLFKFDAPASVLDELPKRRLLRYRQKGGTGRFLTLVEGVPAPADYELDSNAKAQGVEGYVYDGLAPANTPRPLRLYVKGSDYVTSTHDSVPGFVQLVQTPMGYMPSLADYAAAEP